MSALKSKIGTSSGIYKDEITLGRISSFCKAIGRDEGPKAPPIFLTVLRRGEYSIFQKLGLDLAKVLHAGQEYQYDTPILAGDVVSFETILSNVLEKKSESTLMQFMTFETEYTAERTTQNVRIGKAKTTIVVRESL